MAPKKKGTWPWTRAQTRRTMVRAMSCQLGIEILKTQKVSNWPGLQHHPPHNGMIVNGQLIPFITSLPPSVEQIPSAPSDLIKLWEDYVFIYSFQEPWGNIGKDYSSSFTKTGLIETHSTIYPVSEHNISPSHEILQVIVAQVVFATPFWRLPVFLGITWVELRAIICNIGPIISRYDQGRPMRALLRLFPREAYSWAARDLALRFMPRMLKTTQAQCTVPAVEHDAWEQFALLIRLSFPCHVLYRELVSTTPDLLMWSLESETAQCFVHHVFKWLEYSVFPESTQELMAPWEQAKLNGGLPGAFIQTRFMVPAWQERRWRRCMDRWNNLFRTNDFTSCSVFISTVNAPEGYEVEQRKMTGTEGEKRQNPLPV
ncbi:hypothetical protein B0H14DRAFT_2604928 [Mycena olivaceomarginata]|nr:hypothetical protein B0H14DRAFT_2604928 [Mycena olivaceomarginata]